MLHVLLVLTGLPEVCYLKHGLSRSRYTTHGFPGSRYSTHGSPGSATSPGSRYILLQGLIEQLTLLNWHSQTHTPSFKRLGYTCSFRRLGHTLSFRRLRNKCSFRRLGNKCSFRRLGHSSVAICNRNAQQICLIFVWHDQTIDFWSLLWQSTARLCRMAGEDTHIPAVKIRLF